MAGTLANHSHPDLVGDPLLIPPQRLAAKPTALGFGTAPLIGAEVGEALSAIERAHQAGIRLYDTAPRYGLGEAERLLGVGLRAINRSTYEISTKVGWLIPEDTRDSSKASSDPMPAFSRDSVNRSFEGSLSRLGVDHVDIAFIHDPEDHLEDAVREAAPALVELRDQGVVCAIGVGTTDVDAAIALVSRCELDYCLIAGRYSLLDHEAATTLIPLCRSRGVSTIIGGVFNSGILASPNLDGLFDYREASEAVREKAEQLASITRRHGASLAAVALQYPARDSAVDCVLAGMKSAEEVETNVALFCTKLSDQLWQDLAHSGLVSEA
ncbi:MAG TPA: aldo/keto reductase [Gaiellaceae bacterium]|nr:aldo/keto reductase [Gaiellaceae bacterium]